MKLQAQEAAIRARRNSMSNLSLDEVDSTPSKKVEKENNRSPKLSQKTKSKSGYSSLGSRASLPTTDSGKLTAADATAAKIMKESKGSFRKKSGGETYACMKTSENIEDNHEDDELDLGSSDDESIPKDVGYKMERSHHAEEQNTTEKKAQNDNNGSANSEKDETAHGSGKKKESVLEVNLMDINLIDTECKPTLGTETTWSRPYNGNELRRHARLSIWLL